MKTARVFKNGRSQAVRLPKEYRLPGSIVYVKRVGNAIMLIPFDDPWKSLLDSLGQFSSDFMEQREQPSTAEARPGGFE